MITSDWIPVEGDVYKDYDIETTPLRIRTNSVLGSGDKVEASFYTSQEKCAGGVTFWFTSPPKYHIHWCGSWTNFSTDLSNANRKVWMISKIKSSQTIRLEILCDKKEVLNTEWFASDNNDCTTYWSRDVARVHLNDHVNTDTDHCRPYDYQPG